MSNLLLLLTAALMLPRIEAADKVQQLIDRAAAAEHRGQLSEAETMLLGSLTNEITLSPIQRALTLNQLGLVYQSGNQYQKSERCYREAIKLISYSGAISEAEAAFTLNLASMYIESGQLRESQKLNAEALAERTRNPSLIRQARLLKAAMLMAGGDFLAAESAYLANLDDLAPQPAQESQAALATTLNNLGNIAIHRGLPELAITRLEKSLEIWRNSVGREHPSILKSLLNLGCANVAAKRYSEAAAVFQEAALLSESCFGIDNPLTITAQLELANALRKTGRRREAKIIQKSAEQRRASAGPALSAHKVDISELMSLRKQR